MFSHYKSLYKEGTVYSEKLPYDAWNEEFMEGFSRGIAFFASHEPPYLIHCHGGKDRTGFTAMILEMLMGATEEEIVEDYMQTYTNYYGIQPGTEEYEIIANNFIRKSINDVCKNYGTGTEQSNYHDAAGNYLLSIGITQEIQKILMKKLSQIQ